MELYKAKQTLYLALYKAKYASYLLGLVWQ